MKHKKNKRISKQKRRLPIILDTEKKVHPIFQPLLDVFGGKK